jgi:protein-S-isoprenylcysteine O-methyltransferase Ste14
MRRAIDTVERIILLVMFVWLLYRFRAALEQNWVTWAFMLSELLAIVLVLFRNATEQISVSPRDWLLAFGGTLAALLISPGQPITLLTPLAARFVLLGLVLSFAAKVWLNRSFGLVAANRGVKTRGPYGLIRHPMYLGYFLTYAGTLTVHFSAWNAAVLLTWAVLQILRLQAEEAVLSRDPAYQAHALRVPYRLVPWVY